jgi:hypothetical protein
VGRRGRQLFGMVVVLASLSIVPMLRFAGPVGAASGCETVVGNLVQNCGFEALAIPAGSYVYYPPGSTDIPAWTVLTQPTGGVDLTRGDFFGGYPVHQGVQSLDLNHDFQSGVYQELATSPGQVYQLTFFLSGYPAAPAPCGAVNPQTLTVSAGSGAQVASAQSFVFHPNAAATPPGNQAFDAAMFTFTGVATGPTRLTFTSTVGGCTGPIIDDLVVLPTSQLGGTLSGTVYHQVAQPGNGVFGATVELCAGATCMVTSSGVDGHYQVSGLPAGTYELSVQPPPSTPYLRAGRSGVVLAAQANLTGQDVALPDPTAPQPGLSISHRFTTPAGLPVLYWLDPIAVAVNAPPGSTVSVRITDQNGLVVAQGPLSDRGPAPPGSVTPFQLAPPGTSPSTLGARAVTGDLNAFGGSFPPPAPSHGSLDFHFDCTCEGSPADPRTPNDPSGTIVNQFGTPIVGATVTLYRADTAGGPLVVLPSGSDQLAWWSPTNPEISDTLGGYAWDVYPGYYQVRASATGCTAPGYPGQAYVESLVKPVPPAVTGLTLTLNCPAAVTPTSTGSSTSRLVGQVTYPGRGRAPQAPWQQQVEVRFYAPGGTSPVLVRTATTDPQGIFTVDNVPAGPADVRVKQAQTLGRRVNGLSFPAGIPVGVDFGPLPPGDSDNNNLVDIVDFSLLRAVFGTSQTCGTAIPTPSPCADFDGSGLVDIVDFSLLRSTFSQVGPS